MWLISPITPGPWVSLITKQFIIWCYLSRDPCFFMKAFVHIYGRASEFKGVVIKTSVMAEYVLFVRSNCGVVVRANAIARVGLI